MSKSIFDHGYEAALRAVVREGARMLGPQRVGAWLAVDIIRQRRAGTGPRTPIVLPEQTCRHDEIVPLPADADGNVFGKCEACGDATFPISGPVCEPGEEATICGFSNQTETTT